MKNITRKIEKIRDSMPATEERRLKLTALMDKRDAKVQSLKKTSRTAVKKYLSLFPKYDVIHYYNELMTKIENLKQFGDKNQDNDVLSYISKYTKKYLTLAQSYRTTIEIMDSANEVLKMVDIPETVMAKPVVRHGNKPCIYKPDSKAEFTDAVINRVSELKNKEYNTIAIIGKTENECKRLKRILDKNSEFNVKQLSTKDINYEGGTLIVPSYLAKGLEFDAVIIAVMEEDFHENELDLKLLYVAMTRALHSMDVICLNGNMKLLDKADKGKFNIMYKVYK